MKGLLFFLFLHVSLLATAQTIVKLDSGTNASLRGLCVVDDNVIWASGSSGWVARSIDAGRTWQWKQLASYKSLDFRDIEAFSKDEAIMVNAGSPAVVLKTVDGGNTWKETYRNNSPDIFFDGMDFANAQRGMIYGDPIKGKLQLLQTTDGGESWNNISDNITEVVADGEAAFAASGTGIQLIKDNVWFATGGTRSRIFFSPNFGKSWEHYECPIIQGKNSTGIFSLKMFNIKRGVIVGGDYLIDTLRANNMAYTEDGGKSWRLPTTNPSGYKSSVCYISKRVILATGTSGTDVSYDGGKTWRSISPESFNSISKSKTGKAIFLAGGKGRISRINL